jgi:hypothetical protein
MAAPDIPSAITTNDHEGGKTSYYIITVSKKDHCLDHIRKGGKEKARAVGRQRVSQWGDFRERKHGRVASWG